MLHHTETKNLSKLSIFENRNQSLRLTLLIVDDPEGRFTVTPRRRWSYSALIQIRCTLLKTKGSLSTVPSLTFVSHAFQRSPASPSRNFSLCNFRTITNLNPKLANVHQKFRSQSTWITNQSLPISFKSSTQWKK